MAFPSIQNSYGTIGNSTFNGTNWDFSLINVVASAASQLMIVVFVDNLNFDFVNSATWGSQSFTFLPGILGGGMYNAVGYLRPSPGTHDVKLFWNHAGGGQGIGVTAIVFTGAPGISTHVVSNYNFGTSISGTITTTKNNSIVIGATGNSESATQTLGAGQTSVQSLNIGGASSYVSYKQTATSGTSTTLSSTSGSNNDFNIAMVEIISVASTSPSGFFLVI